MVKFGDFYFEKSYVTFRKFRNLTKLAEHLINCGLSIYGSYTHYLVWCAYKNINPTDDATIRQFISSGRHIPDDIDILDENAKLIRKLPHNMLYIRVAASYDIYKKPVENKDDITERDATIIHPHKKLIIRVSDEVLSDYEITIDVLYTNSIRKLCEFDFDINTLIATKNGFITELNCNNDCHEKWHNFRDAVSISKIMKKILHQKAKFIGKFHAGPFNSDFRKRLIFRFRKLLAAGFTIKGWDKKYPTTIIYKHDNMHERQCVICHEELKVGTKANMLPCCSTGISKKVMCDECFWNHLNTLAEDRTWYKCSLCNREHRLFN